MVPVEVYEERFSRLKEVDLEKDRFMEDLISDVKALQHVLTEKKLHLEREQETTKVYQSKHRDVENKLNKMEEDIRFTSFVSVLIDGDSMLFVDRFLKPANEGGMEAARNLRSKVYEYVSNELKLPNNIQIRIRIYANMKGLASTYHHNNIIDDTADRGTFVRGFNIGHSMSDFIDAGDGRECADSKLRAWFEHDIVNVQCQAVIFGGSADGGYARILLPHVGDSSKNKKITLVEGPPFVKELVALKNNFKVACFPDIFRDTKLPARRVSFSTTPPTTPIPNASSYAIIASPVNTAAVVPNNFNDRSVAATVRGNYPLLKNSKGQRLDAIISPPLAFVRAMRDRKLCNLFHILGECTYPDCVFIHGPRLDERGIEARRLIARQAPCSSGLRCEDEKCLFGHQCPERVCSKVGMSCRFTPEMHNVNRS